MRGECFVCIAVWCCLIFFCYFCHFFWGKMINNFAQFSNHASSFLCWLDFRCGIAVMGIWCCLFVAYSFRIEILMCRWTNFCWEISVNFTKVQFSPGCFGSGITVRKKLFKISPHCKFAQKKLHEPLFFISRSRIQ